MSMPGGQHSDTAPAVRGPGGATAIDASERPHPGEKWLPETRRGYTAIGLGMLLCLPVQLFVQSRSDGVYSSTTELMLLFVGCYLGVYILMTWLAFVITPAPRYRAWAERSREGTWVQHYLMGTHPGPGIAQAVSVFALMLGVFWYPRADIDSVLPAWVTGALVAVVVVEAWLTVAVTYTVAYLMRDARSGYQELAFPGDGPRRWTDYFYFSAGLTTSFSAGDVSIRSTGMRRTVTGQSILAFGFNTVILAAVVSVLLR